jgi:hypothetical protein
MSKIRQVISRKPKNLNHYFQLQRRKRGGKRLFRPPPPPRGVCRGDGMGSTVHMTHKWGPANYAYLVKNDLCNFLAIIRCNFAYKPSIVCLEWPTCTSRRDLPPKRSRKWLCTCYNCFFANVALSIRENILQKCTSNLLEKSATFKRWWYWYHCE